MTLKYYHAEPLANSLKSMIPLKEKGLAYESVYVDLHKFEQHSDWFVAINPEGQVPVLDHDGDDRHPHHGDQRIPRGRLPRRHRSAAAPARSGRRGADALLEQVRRRARDEPRLDARLAPHGRA